MEWFRSWHGAPVDSKWPMIAKRSGTVPGIVAATWWALMDYASQNADARGSTTGFDPEQWACFAGFEVETVEAIIQALRDKGLIGADGNLATWDDRQPEREDNSTERVRRFRERKREEKRSETHGNADETHGNAPEEESEIEEETTPTDQQPARERDADEGERISGVIRLVNRGMADNPNLGPDGYKPILPSHGDSRQAVADWRAAGVDWPTIEATVYDKAMKYKPNERYKQIDRLSYFTNPVIEAHERRAALSMDAPEEAPEETSESAVEKLAGDPATHEWARAIDAELRDKMAADDPLRSEVETIRAHLRKANESDRAFARMRTNDQEAFLWIRVLNWYGERTGRPKPSRHLSAA